LNLFLRTASASNRSLTITGDCNQGNEQIGKFVPDKRLRRRTECEALIAHRRESVPLYFSGGEAEYPFDEALLPSDISFRQPADMTFANDVHGLLSRDAAQGAVCRPEPLARHHPLLHKKPILLNDVVHVFGLRHNLRENP
jgi:hypothetical protein